ncbi:MAG: site-specific integrase [Actinomycetota bacterium]|nr:site-specific integrase [Actinomycetota bacterium]
MAVPAGRRRASWLGRSSPGSKSEETRRGYRSDLSCWLGFCLTHDLYPFREIRRIHLELYLRQLEITVPRPANATLYRRISTLSSWFRWLEDEEFNVGNPAARMRRPTRHPTPQP